ncbi:MAG: hypothetical protein V4739_05765 [Pseudomonadota bacterium]
MNQPLQPTSPEVSLDDQIARAEHAVVATDERFRAEVSTLGTHFNHKAKRTLNAGAAVAAGALVAYGLYQLWLRGAARHALASPDQRGWANSKLRRLTRRG